MGWRASDFPARIELQLALAHSLPLIAEVSACTWRDRLLRLGLLVVVLVMQSTYTANLAAFFTAPEVKYNGPLSLEEVRTASACTSQRGNVGYLEPYVASVIAPALSSWDVGNEQGLRFCRDAIESGEADVWLDTEFELSQYMKSPGSCTTLHPVPAIEILRHSVAFGFRREDAQLAMHVSRAMIHLELNGTTPQLFNEHFNRDGTCPLHEVEDTTPVGFTSMAGLYIIFGGLSLIHI
eukprot:3210350-Prymnesium_polylepis.1